MRERGIYPQDCPRTVRSRRNRCGNTELACSTKYHGAKTAYWAVGRQTGNYAVVVAKSPSRYAPVAWGLTTCLLRSSSYFNTRHSSANRCVGQTLTHSSDNPNTAEVTSARNL